MGISGKALGGGRAQEVHTTIIGDAGQADDTTILREMDEIETVEAIFVQTLKDCTEKSNEGKTERIFVSSQCQADGSEGKHKGAWGHPGRTAPDTNRKVLRGKMIARGIAKAWGVGSAHGRGEGSGLSISSRLQEMRGTVVQAIVTFARSMAWTQGGTKETAKDGQLRNKKGNGSGHMDYAGVTDLQDSIADHIRRATLLWSGHVAGMPLCSRPKHAMFGWWGGNMHMPLSTGQLTVTLQSTWLKQLVQDTGMSSMDWFSHAQNQRAWKRKNNKAAPIGKIDQQRRKETDRWRPSERLPGAEEQGAAEELQEVAQQEETWRADSDSEKGEGDDVAVYTCPVGEESFEKGKMLQEHYEQQHSAKDPNLVTTISHRCEDHN